MITGKHSKSRLTRPIQPIPSFVLKELKTKKMLDAYRRRPPYQQNDYLSWINRAKQERTKFKRLAQMVTELMKGDVYMGMKWRGLN
ncbi:MAG: YdeI/OmpD-associated family protein [bacterium]